mgnify:FL=1
MSYLDHLTLTIMPLHVVSWPLDHDHWCPTIPPVLIAWPWPSSHYMSRVDHLTMITMAMMALHPAFTPLSMTTTVIMALCRVLTHSLTMTTTAMAMGLSWLFTTAKRGHDNDHHMSPVDLWPLDIAHHNLSVDHHARSWQSRQISHSTHGHPTHSHHNQDDVSVWPQLIDISVDHACILDLSQHS